MCPNSEGFTAVRLAGLRGLGAAAMLLLLHSVEYAVKRRFGRQINSFVSQSWHDLRRWQVGETGFMANIQYALTLLLAQLMWRCQLDDCRPCIWQDITRASPTLDGARTQTLFGTCPTKVGRTLAGLLNIGD